MNFLLELHTLAGLVEVMEVSNFDYDTRLRDADGPRVSLENSLILNGPKVSRVLDLVAICERATFRLSNEDMETSFEALPISGSVHSPNGVDIETTIRFERVLGFAWKAIK